MRRIISGTVCTVHLEHVEFDYRVLIAFCRIHTYGKVFYFLLTHCPTPLSLSFSFFFFFLALFSSLLSLSNTFIPPLTKSLPLIHHHQDNAHISFFSFSSALTHTGMTKEDDPQECAQALRSVNRSLPPSSIPPPSPDDIFHVDTIVDPNTQKRVVLWDEILQVFEDAVQAQHKSSSPFSERR